MMYLIDRGKLLMQMMHKFHYELPDGCNNSLYGDVMKVIEDAPLIEAEPVRHGHWISLTDCSNAGVYCSVCHKKVYKEDYAWCNRKNKLRSNYCPNCGCKMSKEK